jgi:cytoskeletal protein CcmA (bactofilin family)
MSRKTQGNGGLNSLLGAGVECEGTARVEGTLRLDGSFSGILEVGDTLVIGHTGTFRGKARAREVVIAGSFQGEVLGTEQVELQKGARMEGDVLTRSFVIEPGVFFQGNCRMEYTEADESRIRGAETEAAEPDPLVRSLKK